jgi:hypothetical protein
MRPGGVALQKLAGLAESWTHCVVMADRGFTFF